jgi:hypothetical protein
MARAFVLNLADGKALDVYAATVRPSPGDARRDGSCGSSGGSNQERNAEVLESGYRSAEATPACPREIPRTIQKTIGLR